ncbi:hypothetical protein RMSM_02805 [Rhodopirellula maiorica SM1]|uniref:Uncharacterized protein n=1 Tax=Rhodopirellula maiorica SM1 TaxID=1265738 RepID=M5RM43_9BACT|nr:hypothetical protein RMSM_02805 [Rhodopirellula maiorica SM1]
MYSADSYPAMALKFKAKMPATTIEMIKAILPAFLVVIKKLEREMGESK